MFEERFRKSSDNLVEEIQKMANSVNEINKTLKTEVEDISSTLGWTEMKVDDTASDIGQARAIASSSLLKINDLEKRQLSLLSHLKVPDPIKEEARKEILEKMEKKLRGNKKALQEMLKKRKISIRISGGRINLFTQEELSKILEEAVDKLAIKPQKKKK